MEGAEKKDGYGLGAMFSGDKLWKSLDAGHALLRAHMRAGLGKVSVGELGRL